LTGVQTLVPIMLDHVNAGRLSLPRLADLVSAGPARVYGLAGKGRIALGYDADFTVVDMGRKRVIEPAWIASPCGWSPFSGTPVKGWPIYTIVRGNTAMAEDEVIGTPRGSLARFQGEAVSLLSRPERN
jgi:dihydroorotase